MYLRRLHPLDSPMTIRGRSDPEFALGTGPNWDFGDFGLVDYPRDNANMVPGLVSRSLLIQAHKQS